MTARNWIAPRLLAVAMALVSPAAAWAVSPGAYLAARAADRAGDAAAAADAYVEALNADPRNPALLEAATLNQIVAGRIDGAVATALQLVDIAPDHRIAQLLLTVREIADGDFQAAAERLAAREDAFMPITHGLLAGWVAYGSGDRFAAARAFGALDVPAVAALFRDYHAGLMHMASGDAEAALAVFESAGVAMQGANTRLALAQGAALEALGRDDEARALYADTAADSRLGDPQMEAALARLEAGGPASPVAASAREGAAEALFGLAGALSGEQTRRLALAHAQLAAHLRPGLTPAWVLIGELAQADGQHRAALAAYERVPVDDPLWARAQVRRAASLQATDREDAATEALRALVARMPASVDAHVALADQLRRVEEWEEAAAFYGEAIRLRELENEPDWVLYYQRGIAFERSKQWPKAEADFERALELEPDQPLVLNYLGYSWVDMGLHLDRAKAMIERAVEQRPEDGYITDSLGWVLYRMGDYEGAVEWLERAVEMEPVDPVINDHLGDALWRVGRKVEAAFQWRRARSLEPEPDVLERIKLKLSIGLDAVLEAEAAEAGEAAASGDGG